MKASIFSIRHKILFLLFLTFAFIACRTDQVNKGLSKSTSTTHVDDKSEDTSNELGDAMPIPQELLETDSKLNISFDPPDISLRQSYQDTFIVTSASELYASLGSDRVIMIQSGTYLLPKIIAIEYEHIKLQGIGTDKPVLQFTQPEYSSISVYGSQSVWISNLILDIGYDPTEVCHRDECPASMITIRKSTDIILEYLDMPNQPLARFNTIETQNMLIYEIHIKNSYGFNIDLYNSTDIIFQSSSFKNLRSADNAFSAYAPDLETFSIYFDHVTIADVTAESGDESGPQLFSYNPVFRKCKVSNTPGIGLGIDKEYIIECDIDR